MSGSYAGYIRMRVLQGVVIVVFLILAGRVAWLQLFDARYEEMAKANVLRHVVQYPPRGEVLDRNGGYLVQSRECYDLMVIYSEIGKRGFDTARMCEVLGLSRKRLERELANARMRPGRRAWWPITFPRRISSVSTSAISGDSIPSTAPCGVIPTMWAATCWVS